MLPPLLWDPASHGHVKGCISSEQEPLHAQASGNGKSEAWHDAKTPLGLLDVGWMLKVERHGMKRYGDLF